jgi:hypothetical protein
MYVQIEVYTTDYVLTGYLSSPDERLSDMLNFKTDVSMVLTDVQAARLLDLGKSPPERFVDARIEKRSILFACPLEYDITQKSIFRRTVRRPFDVTVLLPGFKLEGSIHLTEALEVRRVLVGRQDDFIALTHATVTYALYPALTFQRDTVVFNKSLASFIGKPVPVKAAPAEQPATETP